MLSSPPLVTTFLWKQNDYTRTSVELRSYLFPWQLQVTLQNITKVLERCQILESNQIFFESSKMPLLVQGHKKSELSHACISLGLQSYWRRKDLKTK